MRAVKISILTACLLAFAFLVSGCIGIQRVEKADTLQLEIEELRDLVRAKDAEIASLHALLGEKQNELREKALVLEALEKELRAKESKPLELKEQPVLK